MTKARRTPAKQLLREYLGRRLVDSTWVQRLARISFLGTLDFHPQSRTAPSRLEHSLGVAALGHRISAEFPLTPKQRRTFVAACLLHDIGHYPLSHAAEPGFARALGVGHHGVSEWIVCGNGKIPGVESLRPVLEQAGLDPKLVWQVITGDARGRLGQVAQLLKAPINLDTLDGIVRAARAFRIRGLSLPVQPFVLDDDGLWITGEALPVFDRFWALKDRVYCDVINRPSNILCEAQLSEVVAQAYDTAIFTEFLRFDDRAMADHLDGPLNTSGLREGDDNRYVFVRAGRGRQLAKAKATTKTTTIDARHLARTRKRYFLNRSQLPSERGLHLADWGRRYCHERQAMRLVPTNPATQLPLPGLARPALNLTEPEY